jgi:hypothetical protein
MIDYSQALQRLERALGEHYRESAYILGVPGTSLALKVDPFYYLAIQPGFCRYLGRWAGMLPEKVADTLLKTGNMLAGLDRESHTVQIQVYEEGSDQVRAVLASFVLAPFMDLALAIHGGQADPLPVSGLKILASDRGKLDFLFQGKTALQDLAFGQP